MKTETLHSGRHYEAHFVDGVYGGLVVSRKRGNGGVQLRPDHPQCDEYTQAIRAALDHDEAEALCRALLN